MSLDFNTPVCQLSTHQNEAIPASFRLEHPKHGVTYVCHHHPRLLYGLETEGKWSITPINQHTQSAHERG